MRSVFGTRESTLVTIEPEAPRADAAAYEISVVSYQGKPPATSLSAVFGGHGGTIGRGTNNTLVLPDPNRFVSRVQTRIFFDSAGVKIANASAANPLLVNDHELDSGAEEPLHDGDELRIGLYVLKVRKIEAAAPTVTSIASSTGIIADNSSPEAPASSAMEAPASREAAKGSKALPTVGESPLVESMPLSARPPTSQRGSAPGIPPQVGNALSSSSSRPPSTSVPTPARPAAQTAPSAAALGSGSAGASPLGPVDPLQLEFGQSGDDPFVDLFQPAPSPSFQTAGDPVPHDAASMLQPSPTTRGVDASAAWSSLDGPKPHQERAAESVPSPQQVPEHVWDDLAQLAPSASPLAPTPTPLPPSFDAFAQASDSARNAEDPLAEFAQNAVALESLDRLDKPIDTLFGDTPLRSSGAQDVIPDPHAQAPDPLGARDSLDPIAIFDDAAGKRDSLDNAFIRSERDDVPEIEAFFRPPQPILETLAAPPPGLPDARGPAYGGDRHAHPGSDDPLSVLQGGDTSRGDQPRETSLDRPVSVETFHAATSQDAALPTESRPGTYDELLREFLAGAGIPHATMQGALTPALMRRIGRMLAIAVQGTIELIAARALVKREVKADVTIIAATRNNPLKFLPDAESALLQMFGAHIPGFMEPVEAMEDAYRDLRAHEVGVIAGMHAALAEVLKRFEPAELERRLKPAGMLEGLLPNSRQARLWQIFAEMYADISREAQDDFQSLFGKAFLHAYESEVSRLKGQ